MVNRWRRFVTDICRLSAPLVAGVMMSDKIALSDISSLHRSDVPIEFDRLKRPGIYLDAKDTARLRLFYLDLRSSYIAL
jgi:hypothetical protein